MTPDDPRHGSDAGYQAHRRAGQTACDRCKRAAANSQSRRWLDSQQGSPRRRPAYMVERRVKALMAIGWPGHEIARVAGYESPTAAQKLIYSGAAYFARDTFLRIDRAYRLLSGQPGPSEITRGRARAAGHIPPLAWDDIDDPDERPTGYDPEPTGCGTRHGYNSHRRRGERPCQPCRDANAAYQRERKTRRPDRAGIYTGSDYRACRRCGVVRSARSGDDMCGDCKSVMRESQAA